MDDIVTRLRGQRTNGVICEQAADEIDGLRKKLELEYKRADNYARLFTEAVILASEKRTIDGLL